MFVRPSVIINICIWMFACPSIIIISFYIYISVCPYIRYHCIVNEFVLLLYVIIIISDNKICFYQCEYFIIIYYMAVWMDKEYLLFMVLQCVLKIMSNSEKSQHIYMRGIHCEAELITCASKLLILKMCFLMLFSRGYNRIISFFLYGCPSVRHHLH